jgi:hypothetical protein
MPMSGPQQFAALKTAVEAKYREGNPSCALPMVDWKGQEIVNFQEDLMEQVRGRISEKWFYTHIKSADSPKLPRIDMLNMLSKYAGFRDWRDFCFQLEGPVEAVSEAQVAEVASAQPRNGLHKKWGQAPRRSSLRVWRLLVWGTAIASSLAVVFLLVSMKSKTTYTFCFVDADTQVRLPGDEIRIQVLRAGESPVQYHADKQGCFDLTTDSENIRFVVEAPYYKPDTIKRRLQNALSREEIPLKADDYALMIHLFSTSAVKDWQKRRGQLDGMIADEAEIFQLSAEDQQGMEMYNKTEFINKMTMPVKSLRNIKVLETIYDREGRIRGMRFVQTATE